MPLKNMQFRKELRRSSANWRKSVYDALTAEQKIAKMADSPGDSKRQHIRFGIQEG